MSELKSINIPPTNHIKVLDGGQGWIGLLNHMGDENTITNAARVSFSKMRDEFSEKDQMLLKYLIQNKHLTPFEHVVFQFSVHCPLFVRGQWHRHRCLAGDNEVWFTQQNGRNYKMKISQLYRKWVKVTCCKSKSRQKNPIYSKSLISKMNLKCFNENTQEFENTKIIDVFQNGEKEVFEMVLQNGFKLKATADHKILTNNGWKELGQLKENDKVATMWRGGEKINYQKPWFFDFEGQISDQIWKVYREKYLISSYGRVKTTVNTRNVPLKQFKFKKKTISTNGYPCVSISNNGVQTTVNVHSMMAQAFGITGEVIRHIDDNKLNCLLSNIAGGSQADNRKDAIKNGTISKRKLKFFNVVKIQSVGVEKVYDISVDSDFHNFIANGIIVHNCFSYNQISRRYTQFDMEFYFPDNFRKQSDNNKQASIEGSIIENNKQAFDKYSKIVDSCFDTYEELLKLGVCKQQARGVLPQTMMTTFWCTADLRNLINFLQLRDDEHAQVQIREYAKAIKKLIAPYIPHVAKYFNWNV